MTKFTQQVIAEIQEQQKLGMIKANNQIEFAIKHADEYSHLLSVADCADLMISWSN